MLQDIDRELCICIIFTITEKICEQINHSFLYHATQVEFDKVAQNNSNVDISYEISCIDEVFDLPQVFSFSTEWVPIATNEITRLSKQDQEFAQQYLKAKQQYAKVFKKEISSIFTNDNMNITSLDERESKKENETKEVQKRRSSEVNVENPIVKH
ncbi:5262_t:CDS:2 [Scutellospora calospora]|uniref:5262_t:CDS:1 n=1 Tax=Scutellospora calospora TaxID=85575 RepID=A0ACA9KUU7_9GLOM|nr:5262_t:CDS:2 [Scutellospora calospora]